MNMALVQDKNLGFDTQDGCPWWRGNNKGHTKDEGVKTDLGVVIREFPVQISHPTPNCPAAVAARAVAAAAANGSIGVTKVRKVPNERETEREES